MTDELADLLERTEDLCKWLANKIDGDATHQSEKERLLMMADEAANLRAKLDGRLNDLSLDGLKDAIR